MAGRNHNSASFGSRTTNQTRDQVSKPPIQSGRWFVQQNYMAGIARLQVGRLTISEPDGGGRTGLTAGAPATDLRTGIHTYPAAIHSSLSPQRRYQLFPEASSVKLILRFLRLEPR